MKQSLTELNRFVRVLSICILLVAGCKSSGHADRQGTHDATGYSPKANEVEVITLARQDFTMQLLSNGKLTASQKSPLYFGESGTIVDISVANGTFVRKGMVIARLDDSEQRRALATAQVQLERARLDYMDVLVGLGYSAADTASIPEDVKALARVRSGYSAARLESDRAQAALDGTVLKAPFAGKISSVAYKTWERTGSGPFCTLIDDSSFDVIFTVLESEYSFLGKGQTVSVSTFTSEERFYGQIVSVDPSVDGHGQITVKATIQGNPGLLDGMNAKVIVEKELSNCLVVPKKAVVVRDGLDVLFRYNAGHAEWVYVNILDANSESYVVEANVSRAAELSEGDKVIVSGNFNLAEGSRVTLKN